MRAVPGSQRSLSRSLAAPALVALLVVLSGCAAPVAEPGLADGWQFPDDPARDRLGWEAGVWHNESIAVNQSDGLAPDERELLVARTMARVEVIRGLEFRRPVPVEAITRAEYRERSVFGGSRPDEYRAWRDVVWEAPLLVGEDRNASDVFDRLYGGSVAGYYAPGDEQIVVVSDAADPRIDRATLAHELVHALQDQHFGFTGADTRDGALAQQGLTEGDARYVETLYEERCARGATGRTDDPGAGRAGEDAAGSATVRNGARENASAGTTGSGTATDGTAAGGTATDTETAAAAAGEGERVEERGWRCVPRPPRNGGGGEPPHPGVFAYVYQPYADGPAFVHRLRRRGGWAAVNDAYDDRPAATEQTIHPAKYPDERPEAVEVEDRSGSRWSRFDVRHPTEQLGEAGLFAMFWHQGAVPDGRHRSGDLPYSTRDYTAPASAGWAGDRLVPYRRGEGEDAALGYVWAIEFDDSAEAREFARSYRGLLRGRLDARAVEGRPSVLRVPSGPFADAFRVERDGDRVVITNAPTVGALDGVREPPG